MDNTITENGLKIYNVAKECLGTHITLDDNVPHELGCAEAISYILKQTELFATLPATGFPGTAALADWLTSNPLFEEVEEPIPGDIVVYPTGSSSIDSPHGHVFICGKYGLLSNDSATGLFLEVWDIKKATEYYQNVLKFMPHFFRAK